MKRKKQNIENKNKNVVREVMEEAAERLAAILIAQIEFNRNKNKNIYEKREQI